MTGIIRLEPAHAHLAAALHGTSFTIPWSAAEFAQMLAQPGVAGLVWRESEPQGLILIRAVADEAEILTLAVAPEHRRKGVALTLLDEACRMLRAGGTQRLFLEVAADNAAASGLYARYGFVHTGRRAAYYDRGKAAAADALVMSLAFGPGNSLPAAHH